ncbi:hypothetical protein GCM10022600_06000 [Qipengyuania pelagi]|jgi:hypothetical protein|uniref:Secreted protein n=1 Tax=Qipengyuania pelagi TaxID=994320 RepID=A0A844YAR0_9SPHN|nr:hypothetical protein [Qipengyuania pelagi]MXO54971.1 hypothetical protein [Qipengyuania pelagi]
MQEAQLIQLLVVIAVVIALFAVVWFVMRRRKTAHLRDKFGEEYDRTVDSTGGRSSAERNLEERERRVAEFDIRPLTPAERDRFGDEWREVKMLFVDSPPEAVLRADRLLGTMMEARGFPVGDFDRRYEDLTVDHGAVAKHYRDAHDIAEKRGDATTEEMRRAINHYEKLFEELVSETGEADSTDGFVPGVRLDDAGDHDGTSFGDADTVSMTSNGRPVRPD